MWKVFLRLFLRKHEKINKRLQTRRHKNILKVEKNYVMLSFDNAEYFSKIVMG